MPFVPTPAEVALVNQIFSRGDTQKLNVLTGDKAVGIFTAASLPEATLGDIWAIGDPENNGFLTRAGCAKVIRLIGWAQHGETNIGDHLLEQGTREPSISTQELPGLPAACSRTPRRARRICSIHGSVFTCTKATSSDSHNCRSATPHASRPSEVPCSLQRPGPCCRLPQWSVYYLSSYSRYLSGALGERARGLFIRSKLPVERLNVIWYVTCPQYRF